MTPDQLRRAIRAELHAARCRDADHSELRLWTDARALDDRITEAGHPPKHPTSWGTSPEKLAYRAARRGVFSPSNTSGDSECQPTPGSAQ